MASLLLLIASVVIVFVAGAAALWLGARWSGEKRGWLRVLAATFLVSICLVAMRAGADQLHPPLWAFFLDLTPFPMDAWLLFAGQVIIGAFLIWIVVKMVLRVPLSAAIIASLPLLLLIKIAVPAVPLLVKPYVLESVSLHSGSMCPTLLGRSQTAICPQCGGVAFTPWVTEGVPGDENGRFCTCSECLHTERIATVSSLIQEPDEFLVNKLLTPRRWDLVMYRAPHIKTLDGSPTRVRFVKRVVGLPGEEVMIKEGAIWINGVCLNPPEDIAGLRFLDKFEDRMQVLWGTAERPAKLGPDEYFVVGDFGYHSNDSRVWQNKIHGYSPYGLPASYIDGVVDLRYGPFYRWRIFR